MSAALALLRLQQVDRRIDQAQDQLQRTRAEIESEATVAGAREAFQAAHSEQVEAEALVRDAESQANGQRHKLQQAEASLYGGSVRSPKELQDLQADVASLRKHLAALDKAELDLMERLEAAEARDREARTRLDEAMSRRSADQDRLRGEEATLVHLIHDLQTEREAAIGAVEARLLGKYEDLRRTRRGVAVVEISDNSCGACGTVLTAALQQQARHATELVNCPSCGRILFGAD